MIGARFARLVVLSTFRRARNTWCECRCDCGATKEVRKSSLTNGYTRSCGCLQSEGVAARNMTHGKSAAPEYAVRRSMIQRCENPAHKSYPDYGGRGITVCERWRASFEAFLADMGPRPGPGYSIDRIDNAKGYEPGNCRWTTATVQAGNRRPRPRMTKDEARARNTELARKRRATPVEKVGAA